MEDARPTDKSNTKSFLGNSVYVEFDGQRLILTVEDGLVTSDCIYIEWEVWASLKQYISNLK